jgi:PAS domain S-box-containing protein
MTARKSLARENKDLKEALRLARSLIEALAEGTDVIIAAQDTEFRYTFFNAAYKKEIKRLTGKDATVGMRMPDLFADMPEQRKVALDEWNEAMGGKTTGKTIEFGHPARHRRVYKVHHSPVRDEEGRIIGAVEIAYDITKRTNADAQTRLLQDAVARERDRLSALLASITDEIWFADKDDRFTLVNPSGAQEFALDMHDAVDVRKLAESLEVFRPDGSRRPVEEAPPLRALRGELVRHEEEIVRSPVTGELRHRQVSSSPVKNVDGAIIGSVSVVRDVTELKLAEERIRNLASFPEYNTNPVMETDLCGNITYANPAAKKVIEDAGLAEGDINVFLPKDTERVLKRLAEKDGSVFQHETVIGERIFATAIAVVPQLRVGRIYARDITRRKRAEQALGASRNLLQGIIDNSPRYIYVSDLEGRYMVVNRAVAEVFGFQPEKMIGKTRRETMAEEMADRYEAHDREVIKTGRSLDFEEYGVFNGRPRTFLTTKFPLFNADGIICAVAGMSVDISNRKETEESLRRDKESFERLVQKRTSELIRARSELERAKRLSDIGALAATVAHELRNPLAAIGMAGYNIQRKAQSRGLDKHIAIIHKKIRESDQIIDNLLFYSRIRPPQYESVDIQGLIGESIDAIGERGRKQVTVRRRSYPPESVSIEADPTQIREVLGNLLNNAHDAVESGSGVIEIMCEQKDDLVEITVRDNGVGIDGEVLPMVFDPFFTTKAEGTGLGLTVCRQIIGLHGGSIRAESEVGKGTTIIMTLPRERKGC